MHPGYFWTAIGLWSAGGLYLLTGALLNSEDDFCDDASLRRLGVDYDCGGVGTAVIVLGSGLVGGGTVLWILGKNKASAAPQIVTTPGGIGVRSRIGF
jgi:hypothetical protein